MSTVHKVFVSYQHVEPDQTYRDRFEKLFAYQHSIMISKSVQIGDIDENQPVDTVRRVIRDNYLRDSTVTVVLIGQTSQSFMGGVKIQQEYLSGFTMHIKTVLKLIQTTHVKASLITEVEISGNSRNII